VPVSPDSSRSWRGLFRKLALLALPFVIYAAVIVILDPFHFFEFSSTKLDALRARAAIPLNESIWKLAGYSHHLSSNLLLGDSRTDNLPTEQMASMLGEPVYNMAFGAATINEMVDSFWYADSTVQLKRVWMGVNFNQFSDYSRTYRTDAFVALKKHPLLYLINRTVAKAAAFMIYYGLTGKDPEIGKVTVSREEMWREVIGPTTDGYYRKYVDPVRFRADLQAIANHCRAKGIQFRFVIFPLHADLRNKIHAYGLDAEYARFKEFIASLADTYDYDLDDELTRNRENFSDPMHTIAPISRRIAIEISTGHVVLGVLRKAQWPLMSK